MEINILCDTGFEDIFSEEWLNTIASRTLRFEGKTEVEMGILITGQEKIQELNTRYLQEDHPTDVLSFAMSETDGDDSIVFPETADNLQHLGEVIISYPQAVIQAAEHRHPVTTEAAILLIHGILHLLGYDHDIPEHEKIMQSKEHAILQLIQGDML